MMASKRQTPTPAPSNVDTSLTNDLGVGAPPSGAVGTNTPEPNAIGVPKYQTVGGQFVFQGTQYQRVIRGNDGKYYAVDPAGNVLTDTNGTPIEDAPTTDRSGNPIRLQAQYTAPTPTLPPGAQPGGSMAGIMSGPTGSARYNDGDEWAIFASLPPEQMAQVQQAMIDRGIAPSSGVSPGGFDSNWVGAFKSVLGFANANNLTWDDALRTMPLADRTKTKNVQANHYNITLDSPQDLSAVFRKAASSMIGGGDIPQSMIDDYVRGYQEMQRRDQEVKIRQQEAAANEPTIQVRVDAAGNPISSRPGPTNPQELAAASLDTSGGLPQPTITESTAISTPEQVAQQYIKQHFGARVEATHTANAYNLFVNSLHNLGQGPSTTGTVEAA